MRRFTRLILAVAAMGLAAPAYAVTVYFTFPNDPAKGNVAGNVTGHIDGLIDNGTSAATGVFLDSYPAGLMNAGFSDTVFDWTNLVIAENSLTLLNGVIVGGSFVAQSNADQAQLFINSLCCSIAGTNYLNVDGTNANAVWNDNGLSGLISGPTSPDIVTVNFSFSNDPALGTVNGTVTGHIVGLIDNATSSASEIVLDSYPAGLMNAGFSDNVFDWANLVISENSLTLADGVIIGGSFVAQSNGDDAQLFINSQNVAGTNFLNLDLVDELNVWNDGGLQGLSSGPANVGAVPEPATWATMLIGFGAVGFAMRRRKQAELTFRRAA